MAKTIVLALSAITISALCSLVTEPKTNTSEPKNAIDNPATVFVYDYQQGNDGSTRSSVPFFLDGYGLIQNAKEHKKALAAFRLLKYEGMDTGNSSFHVFDETSISKVERFLPKDFDKSKFPGELTATPVLVTFNGTGESVIWLLIADKDSVVALCPSGHWQVGNGLGRKPANELRNFLFMAVFEGLQNDGADIAFAQSIVEEDHGKLFVDKCPICESVEKGFSTYVRGNSKGWGAGLPEATVEKLRSNDPKIRHRTFQSMISRYVKARIETAAFSGDDKKHLLDALEHARKKSMAQVRDEFGDFCPSCDGACSICKLDEPEGEN